MQQGAAFMVDAARSAIDRVRTYVPSKARPISNEVYAPFGMWRDLFDGSSRPFPANGVPIRVMITGGAVGLGLVLQVQGVGLAVPYACVCVCVWWGGGATQQPMIAGTTACIHTVSPSLCPFTWMNERTTFPCAA